jgi:enoyl-CoA hydratase/carnithine racemase
MSDDILVERGPVAVVTLNRPRRINAVTFAMWRELGALFRGFASDAAVRAVVLTGAGGNFSAGADIAEFAQVRAGAAASVEYEAAGDEASRAIMELPKPVIAATPGYCVGGGMALAMACDLRVAGEAAQFGIPAARLGIVYGVLDTRNLLSLVGAANARRILYSAARWDAAAALAMGLVDELAPDPLARARALGAEMAANAPLSIAGAKLTLRALLDGTEAARADEIQALIDRAAASADYAEGRRAFGEKRAPVFMGR